MWERINQSVFGVKAADTRLLTEWRKAQQERSTKVPGVSLSRRRWKAPPAGWVKMNIDAAIFPDLESIGIGCVIRDEYG